LHGNFPTKNKNIFVQILQERLLNGGITRGKTHWTNLFKKKGRGV
jgi:hypothetical protein